ncbi:PorT family protein [Parabacteroides sp. GYB001]|uniref:porin family protein n=1 Tax=Parabacteroides leei TaxID=2939491 RepID=UPI002016FDD2|nr:porin family protein [Parabacteroides leei]MCL3854470.1 PorT family protein [Parabacteroides leei]
MKYVLRICVVFIILSARAYAQSPVSFQVKVGAGLASMWGQNTEENAKFAYRVGVGMEYGFNKTWALQPSLNFVSKGSKEDGKDLGKATVNMLYLELPVMLSARLHLTKTSNLVISGGPYMAYGVGGKTSVDVWLPIPGTTGIQTVHKEYKLNTFGSITDGNMGCKRFDAGVGLGIAYEYRRIVVGLEGQLGLVKIHDGFSELIDIKELEDNALKNLSAFVTVGYKF